MKHNKKIKVLITIFILSGILFSACIESGKPKEYIEIELCSDSIKMLIDVPNVENATGYAGIQIINETTKVVESNAVIKYKCNTTGELADFKEIYIFQENGNYRYKILCFPSGDALMHPTNTTEFGFLFGNWSIISKK